MSNLVARARSGEKITLADKIADITDPRELDGMATQLVSDGRDTPENRALVTNRRYELQKR